jgi:hypothetical protein
MGLELLYIFLYSSFLFGSNKIVSSKLLHEIQNKSAFQVAECKLQTLPKKKWFLRNEDM